MTTRPKFPPLALVIDDDRSIGELCTHALERVGIHVICCDTSVKAATLMQMHSHRIVCILADVVLASPGAIPLGSATAQEGNGARLLPLLKHVSTNAVAVQISAYSIAELSLMGFEVQVPHFLHKPFTSETLRATVKQLLPHLNIPRSLTLRAEEVTWEG